MYGRAVAEKNASYITILFADLRERGCTSVLLPLKGTRVARA